MATVGWLGLMCCILLGHFQVSSSLLWTSDSELPDGFTMAACAGQDVTLAWAYNVTDQQNVVDLQWMFRPKGGSAEDVIATSVHDHFFSEQTAGINMEYIPNGGIRLLGVSASNSGTYSVHVNINVPGTGMVSHVRSVGVDVTVATITTDGSLQAHMIGARFLNSTQQHHLLLTCGVFTPLWVPRVNVLWTTPYNQTVSSTFHENDQFVLAVPNPFVSGEYTCRIDNSSPASLCIASNSPLSRGATVLLDRIEGRIELMDSELQTTNQQLQTTNQQLQTTNQELQTTKQELQTTKDELHSTETALGHLQNLNTNLTSHVSTLESTVHNLQTSNVNLQNENTNLHTQLYNLATKHWLRLVGGRNSSEGRVEIMLNNQWGTVCDDAWSTNDAKVVCRQLKLPFTNAIAYSEAHFGQGSGPIHLDQVRCTGTEAALLLCQSLYIDVHACQHSEDAGVRCA